MSVGLPDPKADPGDLRAFIAVARTGTVGRAARLLHRSQPSVSARLAALESVWSTKLFRRMARGMQLTPEGARLLPLAESVLGQLEAIDREAGLPVADADELRIGSGDALGRELLVRALARLLADRPRLDVRVREGPASRLLDALRDGEIDVALVLLSGPEASPAGIEASPLIESEVRLLAPVGHFEGRKGIGPGDLDGERLVALHAGSSFRRHVQRAFEAAGTSFRPSVEVGNLSLLRRFVATGLGVAPVPAVAFGSDDPMRGVVSRRMRDVPPLVYSRAIRSGSPLTEPVRRLLESLSRGPDAV